MTRGHRIAQGGAKGGVIGLALGLVACPTSVGVAAWMAGCAAIGSVCTSLATRKRRA